jgi:cellulose 1,4-beta-cellobiosidase
MFLYSIVLTSAAQAELICGRWDTIDVLDGEYRILNNVWGATTMQSLEVYPDSTYFSVVDSEHNQSGGTPASYPFILKGYHWGSGTQGSGMPLKVRDVTSAPFSWSVNTAGVGGTWNAAFESWFSKTGGTAPDAAELMIWIDYAGGAGPAGSYKGTVSIGGYKWSVYFADWADWDYIAYKITSPNRNVNLDLKDFIDDSVRRGYINTSWYLDNMEAGFEIWRDGEGLTSNSFSAYAVPEPATLLLLGIGSVVLLRKRSS